MRWMAQKPVRAGFGKLITNFWISNRLTHHDFSEIGQNEAVLLTWNIFAIQLLPSPLISKIISEVLVGEVRIDNSVRESECH